MTDLKALSAKWRVIAEEYRAGGQIDASDAVYVCASELDALPSMPDLRRWAKHNPLCPVSLWEFSDFVKTKFSIPLGPRPLCDVENCGLDAALALSSAWQPIETAPKDDDVLLFQHGEGVRAGYWDDEHGWLAVESQGLTGGKMQPTLWMPLPSPPLSSDVT